MKRSQLSSSPAPAAYSSPPVSPTVTHVSSRSPTPSPSDFDDPLPRASLPSPSPSRSSSPRPRSHAMGSRAGEQADEDDTSIIMAPHRPPMMPSSLSAPAGRLPRLLPLDHSAYADTYLPPSALTHSSTSLSELAHLIRFQRYQEQRRSQSRIRLHRWLVSAALSARLLHCGELAYKTLLDYFRNDDKGKFATLHSALHAVRSSCDATRRYALLEPDLENGKNKLAHAETTNSFSTFMHEIPQKFRNELLAFISELRTNPDFLAARVCSLSQQELLALTSFRPALDPNELSVMASGKVPPPKKGVVAPVASPVERLLSFQRHDPLSALIYTVFANSSGPDSAEDLRRTDAWATTFARLITEAKPGGERLLRSVLDAWAGMRDWPAKYNLELFLMQVIQDGQFLLEKPDGPPAKPGTLGEKLTNKPLEYAAEEFFDRSVKRLFEVIDDEPSAGGMPEGVIEIASAILKKLGHSKKQRHAAEIVIIHRWFFSSFLLNALIFPESHGIMVGYHIPTAVRDKILREIAMRAQTQVLALEYSIRQPVSVMPEVKNHVDSLLARLRQPRTHSRPVLLPAKAVTSPKETLEVQPFLVICPSDIITLVNSLFPERRPNSSSMEKEFSNRGLASSASSVSGISIPFRTASTPGDGSSILSQSATSMTSDSTSREPLLDTLGKSDSSDCLTMEQREAAMIRPVPTEEYGRRLRMACSEMSRILGADAIAGACHPCAERWAVLHVSSDGKELRTRMRKDTEGDDETEEDSHDSDSEDEGTSNGMELENDYHQLKEAVVKLLSEYELPKTLSDPSAFSNGTATHKLKRGGNVLRKSTATHKDDPSLKQLYQTQGQSSLNQRQGQSRSSSGLGYAEEEEEPAKERPSDLAIMLEAAFHQCQSRNEFVNGHVWFKTLEHLRRLSTPSLTRDGYAPLLHYFARGPRDSLGRSFSAIEEFEAWFVWLKQSQERHDANVEDMMLTFKNLRDKMWYKTAVLTSAGYDEAKNVAIALKMMAKTPKSTDVVPTVTHKRNYSKSSSTGNFLLKTEAQVLDLMAAPPEHAGLNKLADEQAEITSKWLAQYGIENFCKGEERIHRFCLEVDKCVNKMVGEDRLAGPVLWSSELYRRDKDILDNGRQDLWLIGGSTLSFGSEEDDDTKADRPASMSLDFVQKPSQSSLRSITTQGSQQSFDSAKWSSGSRAVNLMDAQDYFGVSSPALTIDSTVTFWSPFQTQSQSPSASVRPVSGSTPRGGATQKPPAVSNEDKRRFLLDLKQTLTGLLLSDLGIMVFDKGSETDSWFSGDLGEECIRRKEEEEKKRKQKLAKKKSMRNLKNAREQHKNGGLDASSNRERGSPAGTPQHLPSDIHSAGEHSTASDATARSSGLAVAKKAGLLEFPYNVAFRRLLRKFAAHPNPFAKLHALYDLELLIIASLSAKSGKNYGNRRDTLPPITQSPTLDAVPDLIVKEAVVPVAQAQNLEEAIANVTERRSHTMNTPQHPSGRGSPVLGSRSGGRSTASPPSADMIVDVLQGLFQDAAIRPKTLFRDLQYIAAFVPAQMLDKTARGKAFWDAGLAALGLKQDVCRYMVEIADDIVAENTQSRSASLQQQTQLHQQSIPAATLTDGSLNPPPTAGAGTSPSPAPTNVPSHWTMSDAARMFLITAKEGDAVAERELAIFYLTHPDLLPRAVLPLSKPKEIFKGELLSHNRNRKEDPARSDPMTMCVAQHWMEMSRKGGDELATKYLRARDDIERIP